MVARQPVGPVRAQHEKREAAQRLSEAQLVEARTKAEKEALEAQTRAETDRVAATAKAETDRIGAVARAEVVRLAAQAEADAERIRAEAEVEALRVRSENAGAYAQHPALLRLQELESLAVLSRNAQARIYIGFDKHTSASAD